jgi:hypothetical protein
MYNVLGVFRVVFMYSYFILLLVLSTVPERNCIPMHDCEDECILFVLCDLRQRENHQHQRRGGRTHLCDSVP